MRIWDIPVTQLCRQHLLGEHRELHGMWSILTQGKTGYLKHPETIRWQGKLAALYRRHEEEVAEMEGRGYRHASPLNPLLATGIDVQTDYVDTPEQQMALLRLKGCECSV